jgi:hypothetical protein
MHWFNKAKASPANPSDVMGVAREVAALSESPQWDAFKQLAEKLIESYTPDVDTVHNADHAIEIASRLAFVSGVKRVLGLPEQQKATLKSLLK